MLPIASWLPILIFNFRSKAVRQKGNCPKIYDNLYLRLYSQQISFMNQIQIAMDSLFHIPTHRKFH